MMVVDRRHEAFHREPFIIGTLATQMLSLMATVLSLPPGRW
jgi:hypothetical protein